MEAGDRNWIVTIQQRQTEDETDASGAPLETWTTLVQMPASKLPVRGQERFTAQQLSASYDTRWAINYRADMDPELVHVAKMRRLKHRNRVYDIVGAEMLGLKQGIELLTLAKEDYDRGDV
jgi:SPP1 family predicted phage head-tail adaptor